MEDKKLNIWQTLFNVTPIINKDKKYTSNFVKRMREIDLLAKKQSRVLFLARHGLKGNTYIKSHHGELL